jgi:HD-GYP domain-containing protein (c-di-GMP phosphodiesterase class II)/anti-anti-sigma regulatory factor
MTRTRFERLEFGGADSAGFQISGKLGFHENEKIEQLTQECLKREFKTVVFDFSELTSLGGGVARILRGFAKDLGEKGGEVTFVVTSSVVLDFLQDEESNINICSTMEEAVSGASVSTVVKEDETADPSPAAETTDADQAVEAAVEEQDADEKSEPAGQDGVILMAYDSGENQPKAEVKQDEPAVEEPVESEDEVTPPQAEAEEDAGGEEEIISEIFESTGGGTPPEWIDDPVSPFSLSDEIDTEDVKDLNKKLKRRILELKTLFSISADFNSIRERKKLLNIFLLTSIAQGGVESAVFFERREGVFMPSIAKGVDEEKLSPIELSDNEVERIGWGRDVFEISSMELNEETRSNLGDVGLEYVCPFNLGEEMAGLIFLGKRLAGRGMQKEDFEFMKILVNLAKGAYSNAMMFERENERTLGIVKTLISLIEENTMLKGTSEIVSRYVGMVAKNMDYPEDNFKDLIYGTVLRDMGMVKVSDLIVRSPRELSKDEWQVIKKHPEDGAEMLRRMKFNNHVVDVVLSHHERFNGEGYPRGLRGKDIPMGARIISVVESYAAMINERPNRPALSAREALDTLKENYGLRYDREVVNTFAEILEKEIAKSVQPVGSVS